MFPVFEVTSLNKMCMLFLLLNFDWSFYGFEGCNYFEQEAASYLLQLTFYRWGFWAPSKWVEFLGRLGRCSLFFGTWGFFRWCLIWFLSCTNYFPVPRACDNSRLLRKQQLMEEHEQALELERRRLSELHFTAKTAHPYFGYSMDEFKHHSDGLLSLPKINHFLFW